MQPLPYTRRPPCKATGDKQGLESSVAARKWGVIQGCLAVSPRVLLCVLHGLLYLEHLIHQLLMGCTLSRRTFLPGPNKEQPPQEWEYALLRPSGH